MGDVVICPSVAAANAAACDRSVEDEIALLVVHGALHLLGYDHIEDRDAEKMETREQELLASAATMAAASGVAPAAVPGVAPALAPAATTAVASENSGSS